MTTDSETMAMDYAERQAATRRPPAADRKQKSWPQRKAYLAAWNRLCATKGWNAKEDAMRKALRTDILEVLGEAPKAFDDLTPVEFGTVLWVFNEMADGRTPTVEQILERAEWERRNNLMWVIRKLAANYDPRSLSTLLLARFKMLSLESLGDQTTETLKLLRVTLTARTYQTKGS